VQVPLFSSVTVRQNNYSDRLSVMAAPSQPDRTLAVTNLPDWVDDSYLYQLFLPTKSVVCVRMARGRCPGGGKLAHLQCNTPEAAEGILKAYNGTLAPNTSIRLDISWASDIPKCEGEKRKYMLIFRAQGSRLQPWHMAWNLTQKLCRALTIRWRFIPQYNGSGSARPLSLEISISI
jgi:hypothetical protein